jgi:hypothetical protein
MQILVFAGFVLTAGLAVLPALPLTTVFSDKRQLYQLGREAAARRHRSFRAQPATVCRSSITTRAGGFAPP